MPSPAAPRHQRRKEARPAEIMAAALKLFSERGFAATRLEDVADAAGVSKATIYLYFDSKADLFKAMIRDIAAVRISAAETMIDDFKGSTADLIRSLLDLLSNIAKVPELRALIKVVLSEAGNFPDIAAFYRDEVALRGLQNIARIIERGVARGEFRPCDAVATGQSIIFPILMNGLAREIFGPMPQFDPDRFFASHCEFVLRGLAANREA
jgi:AcrR family transcriptional regulator